jgi:hypothetical protein
VLNDVPDDPADRERCFRLQEGEDDIVRVVWERDVRVTGGMAKQAIVNRPGIARGSGSGHLAPLGDGVSIHDFTFNGSQVVD